MHYSTLFTSGATLVTLLSSVKAAPALAGRDEAAQVLANPNFGPVPSESDLFVNYSGTAVPFPANYSGAILNTTSGPAGADDELFQNLLSAEWIIFSFYQQAVELFNQSVFTALGLPNTTYQRVCEIRDNEAGHLRIFQNEISSNSVKPGPCKYEFGLSASEPQAFLATLTLLEISSMAFLTGLVYQASFNQSKAALTAISATESRHETWSLISVWDTDPFAGPVDTAFPYANQILDSTREFIIPGSCPAENPQYPTPSQGLPLFTAGAGTTGITPGSTVVYNFSDPTHQPNFTAGQDYHAVFFHGLTNITQEFNTTTNSSMIPPEFDALGIIIAVIATEPGAPTADSVIAGPGIILQQPLAVGEAIIEGA